MTGPFVSGGARLAEAALSPANQGAGDNSGISVSPSSHSFDAAEILFVFRFARALYRLWMASFFAF